jgi:phosphatidylserine/phosphatidylglycerophosphate/cardiolipin synthase-like enzyme
MAGLASLRIATLLAVCSTLACDPSSSSTSPDRGQLEAAPAATAGDPDGSIRLVMFAPDGRTTTPSDRCEVELCTSLLALIQAAQTSIDFAVYGMRNQPEILAALQDAKARGVRVRGIVDRDAEGDNYYSSTETWIAALHDVKDDRKVDQQLEREQKTSDRANRFEAEPACERPEGFDGYVQCLAYDLGDRCLLATHASREPFGGDTDDDGGGGKAFNKIMHDKFFVVDGRYLWTGSTNVSDSCAGGYNANLVVVLDSPTVAGWYTHEFEQMYVDGKHHQQKAPSGQLRTTVGDAQVQVLFSPQDKAISEGVRPVLKRARKRIDIAVFFLTNKAITKDLIDAHRRGVEIRVILDATAAENGYTKHELLREVGIPVKVEDWGGKMHMKSAVVDDEWLIVGSMNWTSAGEWDNDENTLIIKSRPLAQQYAAFFETMWADIPDRWATANPDPESRDSGTSCIDGFDNDYDHMPDAEDPGCGPNPPPMLALPPHWVTPKDKITCQHPPRPGSDSVAAAGRGD